MYPEIENLLREKNIMRIFFNRIAGHDRYYLGTWEYILHINYETNDKKVIVKEEVPVLNLKNGNYELFMKSMERYARTFFESDKLWANPISTGTTLEDKLVYSLVGVLLNITGEDYENPAKLFDRYTNFLKDTTFEDFKFGQTIKGIDSLNNCDLEIKYICQDEFQETPEAMVFTIKKGNVTKTLPRIACGIDGDTAYIYGIQGIKEPDTDSSELKAINRKRFKVNNMRNIPEEYRKEYSSLEPYAYISLFAYLCMLKQKGITNIKMPSFLPERYYSKIQTIIEDIVRGTGPQRLTLTPEEIQKHRSALSLERKAELQRKFEIHDKIQYNRTNKFLSYMTRLQCDIPGIEIKETPEINNGYLAIDISKMDISADENDIFKELFERICDLYKAKQKGDHESEYSL